MDLINLYIEENPADKSGVSAIALVDSPAIEESWIAFNKQNEKVLRKYRIQLGSQKGDFKPVGDQQVLAGALMVPNKKIYRKDDKTGYEYEVTFTPDTIKKIQEKFISLNLNNAVNEMHQANQVVDGTLIQQFIIDRAMGLMPPMGQDHLEDGTWYGYIKVKDQAKWEQYIKTGIYTGFSVEGNFYEEPISQMTKADIEEMASLLGSFE